MPTKRKTPPRRDADQTTLTISLPKKLKDQIEAAAKSDNRSTSNFMVTEIAKLLGIKIPLIAALLLCLWQFVPQSRPTLREAGKLAQSAAKAVAAHVAKL